MLPTEMVLMIRGFQMEVGVLFWMGNALDRQGQASRCSHPDSAEQTLALFEQTPTHNPNPQTQVPHTAVPTSSS